MVILGALIILCIGQTIQLWLGDMSGHTFFTDTSQNIGTQPKDIWVNYSGLAYKIEGNNNESRKDLLMELAYIIRTNSYNIDKEEKLSYRELLEDGGFVYEYALPLGLSEIIGYTIKSPVVKDTYTDIMTIFVKLNKGDNKIYLIDDDEKVKFCISTSDDLQLHNRINSYYMEDNIEVEEKSYQSTLLNANYSTAFEHNIFYPLDNTNKPFIYQNLKMKNVISYEKNKKIKILESYMDAFFKNPDYKYIHHTDNGIVFSDALDMNVYYDYKGYIEFNKRYEENNINISRDEQLSIVNKYIDATEQIPYSIKQGIFLKEIKQDSETEETRYKFGYKYKGFEVLLSQTMSEAMEMDCFVEIGVKGNQVVHGKWLMKEIVQASESTGYNDEMLQKEGYVAISEAQNLCGIEDMTKTPLSDLQCAYIVDEDEYIDFKWAALYKDEWYYK